MYQGHKTKDAYKKAWHSHANQLQWMFWDSLRGESSQDTSIKVEAAMRPIRDAIDSAADKLEAAGKFELMEN
jgi:hypothetical protein